jgi:two-component sensor histidine kinase
VNENCPPSWCKRLDFAILDYCSRNGVSPHDVVESVSDFLRGVPTARESLIRAELRHRTKNEMQFLIHSIWRRQSSMPHGRNTVIDACIGQVVALANLNDVLDCEPTGHRVDLSDLLTRIVTATREAFHLDDNIRIEFAAEPILVTAESARNVVLILNEALTNAIKHACGENVGIVRVVLGRTSSTGAELSVDDDGQAWASTSVEREGSSLIDALAAEIDGRIHRVKTRTGFRISCVFPVD